MTKKKVEKYKPIGPKQSIKQLYTDEAEDEWKRLIQDSFHKLEFDTTFHFLNKYLPKKGLILDAGGGPGRYTIELAKKGYQVILLDLTPKPLKTAKSNIKKAGVEKNVKDVINGSITDLSSFKDNYFDSVLCLGGPLSHVKGDKARKKAITELIRVTKKGGFICISVMSRLGVLLDTPIYWPQEIELTEHFRKIWREGEDDLWRGGRGYCHFYLPEELTKLTKECGNVEIVNLAGLEGLAHTIKKINNMSKQRPKAWRNWLEMHYELCTHPAVVATSGHFMLIVRKK
jgi:ubiquinone/menaquinone biosynthesis C-methylase UbiE